MTTGFVVRIVPLQVTRQAIDVSGHYSTLISAAYREAEAAARARLDELSRLRPPVESASWHRTVTAGLRHDLDELRDRGPDSRKLDADRGASAVVELLSTRKRICFAIDALRGADSHSSRGQL